jgi:DNA-binding ferritin-like protein
MNQIQTELSIPDSNQVYIKSLEFMCKTLTKDVANLTMEVFELKKILEEKESNTVVERLQELLKEARTNISELRDALDANIVYDQSFEERDILKQILEEKELIDDMGNKIIWKVKEYILQNYSR